MNPQMMETAVAQRIRDIQRQAALPAPSRMSTAPSRMSTAPSRTGTAPSRTGTAPSRTGTAAPAAGRVRWPSLAWDGAPWSQARRRLGCSLIAAGLRLLADGTAPQA